jgi:hypothetical protein
MFWRRSRRAAKAFIAPLKLSSMELADLLRGFVSRR